MKLKPLSQLVLQQTLHKHQAELEQIANLCKDNDAAPSSYLLDIQNMQWVAQPTNNDATGATL
jgi:urease accessory protein UreF